MPAHLIRFLLITVSFTIPSLRTSLGSFVLPAHLTTKVTRQVLPPKPVVPYNCWPQPISISPNWGALEHSTTRDY